MREVMDQVSGLHLDEMALALDGEHAMSRVWANCSSIDVTGGLGEPILLPCVRL